MRFGHGTQSRSRLLLALLPQIGGVVLMVGRR